MKKVKFKCSTAESDSLQKEVLQPTDNLMSSIYITLKLWLFHDAVLVVNQKLSGYVSYMDYS